MKNIVLKTLERDFTIHRFESTREIPAAVFTSSFYWIGKTDDELSVVCDAAIELGGGKKSTGWACLKVVGPIDFSETGVLAGVSAVLAAADISIFAISTFDTDYILLPSGRINEAIGALVERGYQAQGPLSANP